MSKTELPVRECARDRRKKAWETGKGREEAMHSQDAVIHRCSFCNKDQNDVLKLIAGVWASR